MKEVPRDKLQAYHVYPQGISMTWTKVPRKMNPAKRPGFARGEEKHLAARPVRECVPARVGPRTAPPDRVRILSKNSVGKNEESNDEES
jgi:hypothetical protein